MLLSTCFLTIYNDYSMETFYCVRMMKNIQSIPCFFIRFVVSTAQNLRGRRPHVCLKPSLATPYLVGSYTDPHIAVAPMNGYVHAAGITELVIIVAVAVIVDDIIGLHNGRLWDRNTEINLEKEIMTQAVSAV